MLRTTIFSQHVYEAGLFYIRKKQSVAVTYAKSYIQGETWGNCIIIIIIIVIIMRYMQP